MSFKDNVFIEKILQIETLYVALSNIKKSTDDKHLVAPIESTVEQGVKKLLTEANNILKVSTNL